ncbi:MAG: hypothetical protein LBI29_01050, partial [Rickettsiales bacterium]|nr:hypothetical protein [Rickettsiales bacterium]
PKDEEEKQKEFEEKLRKELERRAREKLEKRLREEAEEFKKQEEKLKANEDRFDNSYGENNGGRGTEKKWDDKYGGRDKLDKDKIRKIEETAREAEKNDYQEKRDGYNKKIDKTDNKKQNNIYENETDPKLPEKERGTYREFDINPSTGGKDRGLERIVIDKDTGDIYYTPDHYHNFIRIR